MVSTLYGDQENETWERNVRFRFRFWLRSTLIRNKISYPTKTPGHFRQVLSMTPDLAIIRAVVFTHLSRQEPPKPRYHRNDRRRDQVCILIPSNPNTPLFPTLSVTHL